MNTHIIVAGIILAESSSLFAQGTLLYQSTTSPTGLARYEAGGEFGNEIHLASGQSVTITSLAFEYSGAASTADLRIYENDGLFANSMQRPGTLLFDSGSFSLPSHPQGAVATFTSLTPGATPSLSGPFSSQTVTLANDGALTFNPGVVPTIGGPLQSGSVSSQGVTVTGDFTWTVSFNDSSGPAGLDFYGPPTIGQAYNLLWNSSIDGFLGLVDANNSPSTFGAVITVVPEPGV